MSSVHEAAVCALKNALGGVWLCQILSGRHSGGHACSAESSALKQQWVRSTLHCGLCGCANPCLVGEVGGMLVAQNLAL